MRKTYARTAVIATGIATVAVTGVAFAAFNVSGTSNANPATANGKATHSVALTVSAPDSSQGWYPQLANVPVSVTVDNPNPFRISVATITVSGYHSDDATCEADLHASGVSNVFTGSYSTPFTLLGKATTADSATKSVNVSASNDLPNSCQDHNLTLVFTASGASS
jgi:hypothetical protein